MAPNGHHVACCYASGTVAVYEVSLPPEYYVLHTQLAAQAKAAAAQDKPVVKEPSGPPPSSLKPATPPVDPNAKPSMVQAVQATAGPQAEVRLVVYYTVAAAKGEAGRRGGAWGRERSWFGCAICGVGRW